MAIPYAYIDTGGSNGEITGLGRSAYPHEAQGFAEDAEYIHGLDYNEFYSVIDGVLTPVDQVTADGIRAAKAQEIVDAESRDALLTEEKEAEGWWNMEPDEIRATIETLWSGATTDAQKLNLLKTAVKKLAVYVLK